MGQSKRKYEEVQGTSPLVDAVAAFAHKLEDLRNQHRDKGDTESANAIGLVQIEYLDFFSKALDRETEFRTWEFENTIALIKHS